jgi:hypothetical protein
MAAAEDSMLVLLSSGAEMHPSTFNWLCLIKDSDQWGCVQYRPDISFIGGVSRIPDASGFTWRQAGYGKGGQSAGLSGRFLWGELILVVEANFGEGGQFWRRRQCRLANSSSFKALQRLNVIRTVCSSIYCRFSSFLPAFQLCFIVLIDEMWNPRCQ